ncbi:MAG: DUF1643 domain-containing protein [Flavobacteriales bacterium]|nr:DUF1643 domain-containing protein [Flavobacteriales bacterium]
MQESTIKRHALLSKDKKYRYSLKRIWDNDKPKVLFIMLNPSLADNYQDDPTIRRLIKFAKLYGYGGFYVGNLFSYITPYPSELLDKDLMFSKKNIHEIKKMTGLIKDVVYGWGNSFEEPEWLKQIISNPKCFGKNKNKTPKHPLYLSYNHKLVNYR